MKFTSRFKDAPWFEKAARAKITVGGVGGIGSWATILLQRIGAYTQIYDFDVIDSTNLGGQLFREHDIGYTKVSAVKDIAEELCGRFNGDVQNIPINEDRDVHNFCFSCFDNMTARKALYKSWKRVIDRGGAENALFVDGRLSAEQIQVFIVKNTPESRAYYESTLFEDSEVEDEPCTFKQTSHIAAMIASYMVTAFTNHLANLATKDDARNVPDKIEMFCPLFLTEIEHAKKGESSRNTSNPDIQGESQSEGSTLLAASTNNDRQSNLLSEAELDTSVEPQEQHEVENQ